jgi:DNA topoisomerase-1
MRTDSLRISEGAQLAAKSLIGELYGEEYLPKTPRVYKAKASAQDAHEAIRPSNVALQPNMIKKYLSSDQYRLYRLIWERFIASQMEAAVYNTVSIDFLNSGYVFKTSGYNVKFRGYTVVYDNTELDAPVENEQSFSKLPEVGENEIFRIGELGAQQHFTEPPMRYTEGSLIKFLEENGIGRPSTFTTIITTIIDRGYVKREAKSLVPTPLGEVITKLMIDKFPNVVNYEFTAQMENQLDEIEAGTMEMESILAPFYDDFSKTLDAAMAELSESTIAVPDEASEYPCPKCGSMMIYKNGRYGRFLACPNYPECQSTQAIDKEGKPLVKEEKKAELADFKCEICGGDVVIRNGRFGSFYACANYPTCKFTKQKVNRIGVTCPDCGADVVAKRGRQRVTFYSCEKYPECQFSSWDIPTAETCPDCGDRLLYRKLRKTLLCRNKSCDYKRVEDLSAKEQGSENE